MDVRYINPFIASTRKVFAEMVRIELLVGKPSVRKSLAELHEHYALSATIDFSGPAVGRVVLSMSEPVCMAIAAGLLGAPVPKINEDCYDAIAELINMITGGAKKQINADMPIKLSIPRVMRTELIEADSHTPILMIPFETTVGHLLLQVSMTRSPARAATTAAADHAPAAPAVSAAAAPAPAASAAKDSPSRAEPSVSQPSASAPTPNAPAHAAT